MPAYDAVPADDAVPAYDAVVLAGGAGRRLGGPDKVALTVGPMSLLDHAVAATARAGRTVVVGPLRPTRRVVRWARESPPGGGPVAALAAGLGGVRAELVAVLAADQPFLTAALVDALAAACTGTGALLVDATGRDQLLAGMWRTAAVRAALPAAPAGAAVRTVLGPLVTARLPAGAGWLDCDTGDDLRLARSALMEETP